MLSQDDKNALVTALFSNGRRVFLIVDAILSQTLADRYRQTNTKSDLLRDIPIMYRREGAIDELNKLRVLITDLENDTKKNAIENGANNVT
jgi:hypothetical protein